MAENWTIRSVLSWTTQFFENKGLDSPRLDAELLIAHALELDRLKLYLDLDRPLLPSELALIRTLIKRRAAHEPIAYILGERAFWKQTFKVSPAVLCPRPETEHLVELALQKIKSVENPKVVDVGTGSGCVILSIKGEREDAVCTGVDISPEALEIAEENAVQLELACNFEESDCLSQVEGPFDAVVSNPPYIASAEIPKLMADVAQFEPHLALDGGADGLEMIRKLAMQAAEKLVDEGWLLFEIGADQGEASKKILSDLEVFDNIAVHQDYAGLDRVCCGQRKSRT